MGRSRSDNKTSFTLHTPLIESMEPRVLYSADPLAALVNDVLSDFSDPLVLSTDDIANELLSPESTVVGSTASALYVVDRAVADYEELIESLALTENDELLLLDSESGLIDISFALMEHQGVSELHLFTHSEASGLRLGGEYLDFDSANESADLFQHWADALAADADILLYGCNLAATDDGIAFVDLLSQLSGADVAASTNLTGNHELDADWELEYKNGEIETDIEQTARSLSDWNGILANLVVTTELDVLDGNTTNISTLLGDRGADGFISLREAIIAANNTPGADSISLLAPVSTYTISLITDPAVGDAWETGDFDVQGDLVIRGDGPGTTVISAEYFDRVFEIESGDIEFHDLTITKGAHDFDAGTGISVISGNVDLFNVEVLDNHAHGNIGGGIFLANGATLDVSESTFSGNFGTLGGALFVEAGATANLHDTDFSLNNATLADGGAIFSNGQLDLTNSSLTANIATASGGALSVGSGSHATIFDVDFLGNSATSGGAINNLGELEIAGGYFENNVAETGGVSSALNNIGGAIYTSDTLVLESSTFLGNTAYAGGAVYTDLVPLATANNVTFDGNRATHEGGGLFVNGGSFDVTHATIVRNIADPGGGGGGAFLTTPNSLSLSNSVLGQNSNGGIPMTPNLNFSAGYNVSQDPWAANAHFTDIVAANPGLGTLQDNGGLVPTVELLAGSDAIDAGTVGPRIDATGRIGNEISDAGAFEFRQTQDYVKVYWTDSANKLIYRANSTGGVNPTLFGVQAIASTVHNPWDIEYDAVNERIIWTENNNGLSGRIMQSDLSGENQVVLDDSATPGISGLLAPRGLALDTVGGKLYVINHGAAGGTSSEFIVYDLLQSSIQFEWAGAAPPGALGAIDAQDIEFISDPDFVDDWLVWGDNAAPGEAAGFAFINLTTTGGFTSVFADSPSNIAPTEFTGLSWDEANNTIYIATDQGVGSSVWDLSGTTPVMSNGSFFPPQFASGVQFNPLHNSVYSTVLGSGNSNGQISGYAQNLTSANLALANVNTPKHITLATVSSMPEPPILQLNNSLTLNEGSSQAITITQLNVTDADTSVAQIVYTLESDVFNGVLELNGTPIGMGQSFTQQDLNNSLVSYVHNDSETTVDYFLFSVSDGIHVLENQRFNIDIVPQNDHAPVAGNGFITVAEDQIANTATTLAGGMGTVFGNLAAITTDADVGDILTYSASANAPSFGVAIVNSDGTFSYDFTEAFESASDVLEFTVTDLLGQTSQGTLTIEILPVNDSLPLANTDFIQVDEGGTQTSLVSGSASVLDNDIDTDLPDDVLSVESSSVGTFATAGGLITLNTDGTFSYTHNGSEVFGDSFTYTITDAVGQTSTNAISIQIFPDNDNFPVVQDEQITVVEGATAIEFVSGNSNLLGTLTDGDAGDSATVQPLPVSGPANGSVVFNADNTFSYTHDGSETLNDQFIYRVEDSGSNTTDVTVTIGITPVNENAPVVPDDTITLAEGTTATQFDSTRLSLLDNLVDADQGDTATVQLQPVVGPASGSVIFNADDSFSYTHDGSETTTDQFIYRVEDSAGNTSDVTVDITVLSVNDAPVGQNGVIFPNEDTAYTFQQVDFGYSDPAEQHGMSGVLVQALPGDGTLFVAGVPVVVGQTVTVADIDAGNLVYVPEADFNGPVAIPFVFRVADTGGTVLGGQDTDTQARDLFVTVIAVNDAPQGTDGVVQTIEDTALVLDFSDFGYSDVTDDNAFAGIFLDALPLSGTVLLSGQPVTSGDFIPSISLAAGELAYMPDTDVNGQALATLGFRVMDNGGTANGGLDTDTLANTLTIDVLADNDAPIASSQLPDLFVEEGETLQYLIPVSTFTDPDGDTLSLTVVSADGSNLPWLTFDPVAGLLNAEPGFSDSGTYPLVVIATDADGVTASQNISLEVQNVNLAPLGLQPTEATVDENISDIVIASLTVDDPDVGDSHGFTVDDPRFQIVNGELILIDGSELDFEQEAQVELTVTITDASGAATDVPFVVNVNDLNETPQLQAELNQESGSAPFAISLPEELFVDQDGDELVLSLSLMDGAPLPPWIIFNADTGVISVTEDAPTDTVVDVVITATDPDGASASSTLQLILEPELGAATDVPVPVVEEAEEQVEVSGLVETIAEIEQLEIVEEVQQEPTVEAAPPLESEPPPVAAVEEEPQTDLLAIADVLNVVEEVYAPVVNVADGADYTIPATDRRAPISPVTLELSEFSSIANTAPLASLFSAASPIALQPVHTRLAEKLDLQRQGLKDYQISVERVTQTTVSVGTGISVGYIVWLLRSGVVLGSMLSALPAWRSIDPLPILSSLDGADDEDGESLESMVEGERADSETASRSLMDRVLRRN